MLYVYIYVQSEFTWEKPVYDLTVFILSEQKYSID